MPIYLAPHDCVAVRRSNCFQAVARFHFSIDLTNLLRVTACVFTLLISSLATQAAGPATQQKSELPELEAGVDTNTGVLTHAIEIDVPPGPGGLEPGLALVYSSRARAGVAGAPRRGEEGGRALGREPARRGPPRGGEAVRLRFGRALLAGAAIGGTAHRAVGAPRPRVALPLEQPPRRSAHRGRTAPFTVGTHRGRGCLRGRAGRHLRGRRRRKGRSARAPAASQGGGRH